MVPVLLGNDLLLIPKFCLEPAHVWTRAVALKGCQETALVQSVIGFSEIQKNQEEWVLIDASKLLRKFELQYGLPHSSTHAEAMEDVV